MRPKIFIILAVLLLALSGSASAYWPTTLRENFPVAVDDTLFEKEPFAIPYPNNSTLVVYHGGWLGYRYQIIDHYGQLAFPEPQSVWPAMPYFYSMLMNAIHDGEDGALISWRFNAGPGQYHYCLQRLDAQGNRLYGDSASVIVETYGSAGGDYDVQPDGNNGFYLAMTYQPDFTYDILAQHIDELGNPLWGDSGRVILSGPQIERYPKITQDDTGGFYVIWEDWRPPYNIWGSLHMQRFDSEGNPMWSPADGLFLCENVLFHQVIPDGEGGFILHANPEDPYYNNVIRVGPDGDILWNRDHVSWYYLWADIIPGEPGFFYLGFVYGSLSEGYGVYGQRMDIQGRTYWPTWGSGHVGAEFGYTDRLINGNDRAWHYRYPYFYCFYTFQHIDNPLVNPKYLLIQALDPRGQKVFRDRGAPLSVLVNSPDMVEIHHIGVAPDEEGGVVGVWCEEAGVNHFDIWAKRINPDGTLGGPEPQRYSEKSSPQISGTSSGLIRYNITESGTVTLDLYNLLGRHVRTLESLFRLPGSYAFRIDPSNLASGVYFIKLSTATGCQTEKIVIAR